MHAMLLLDSIAIVVIVQYLLRYKVHQSEICLYWSMSFNTTFCYNLKQKNVLIINAYIEFLDN